MKGKFLMLLAASALILAGCSDDDPVQEPAVDSVSVTPKSETFTAAGETLDVTVTSSGAWALTGESDWVSPSTRSGVDGDVVRFTVTEDDYEADQTANFTFTVGSQTAPLALTLKVSTTPPSTGDDIKLLSDEKVTISREAGEIIVELDTDIYYRDLDKPTISSDAQEWLSHRVTIEDGDVVKMYFDATENTTYAPREGVIHISGGDSNIYVTVTQEQTDRLDIDQTVFFVELEGGSVEIQVEANVEYEVVISESARSWLTLTNVSDDGLHTFTAAAIQEGGETTRTATITFEQTDGELVRTAAVTQKGAFIIGLAAGGWAFNRGWPGPADWNDRTPVTNMTEFTLESLIYVDEFTKSATRMSVIMGVEGKFQLRLGDDGTPVVDQDQLQVTYTRGTTTEYKITDASLKIEPQTWYHVAVTYSQSGGFIKMYLDGEEKASVTENSLPAVNFGVAHNNESGSTITRCFWIGYGFTAARYWPGLLSEMRIWNKALTEAELNSENHFYTVEPTADGLVSYWKMDDGTPGTENVIKDHTSYANHITVDSELDWTVVSIP